MRYFNTAGPVKPDRHYCIPPLDRLDLDEVLLLVRQEKYFVLHAPRQSGKTSTLRSLCDLLNSGARGAYRCVYVNVESAQAMGDDVERATRVILARLAARARAALGDLFLARHWSEIAAEFGPAALGEALMRWAAADPTPLVLLIDEIDALAGDPLLAVLRQLREGYDLRPEGFPHSVCLCGVRDVRDYRIPIRGDGQAGLGSPFNVKAKSLRLDDFSEADVGALLGQHTAATGQKFTPEAVAAAWDQTRGQPWLVNALAWQACFENAAGRERRRPVTAADLLAAREELILRRETHLDQLADKLREERVRRVVEPLLSGAGGRASAPDLEYVRDLGLVAPDPPVRIANPVYAEVVPRELTWITQQELPEETAWYVDAAGGLKLNELMVKFREFFRRNSEHWKARFQYQEAWPQLLLQAFLQRIVNGGGRIDREYGLGRGRTDLLIEWPQGGADGGAARYVVECKVRYGNLERTIAEGVAQTAAYLDRCAADRGHLVIFDRSEGRSWDEKVFHDRRRAEGGGMIEVWGM